jgi:hypothetical protein
VHVSGHLSYNWMSRGVYLRRRVVELANYVRKTPRCPRCVHLLLTLYTHFDICDDAFLGRMSSLAGHDGTKFAFVNVFHVQ